MRIDKYIYAAVVGTILSGVVVRGQEAIGINFFDISQAYTKSFTCWSSGKSAVYAGSLATFTTCSSAVPVDMSVGNGSLVFQSTLPSGWWNLEFKLDWGHSVNFLRYGAEPLLYLRLKWGAIAPGADLQIELRDDQQILSSYYNYNGTGATYPTQAASVLLSSYVIPSTADWQDVYIPMSDFLANNRYLDLTRIGILKFYGAGSYSVTNTMYIEKIKIVPSIDRPYTDMFKINQLGYTTQGRKLALVSYESGAVPSAPTYFQLRDAALGSVMYQGNLVLKTRSSAEWDLSGDTVYHADFTEWTTPGTYYLAAPEIGQISSYFIISDKAFNAPFRDALRFFYFARSGNMIAEPFAQGHPRPTIYANNSACAYDYDDNDTTRKYDYDPQNLGITTRDVRGGWFDAADLHLDVHNNVTTLWFLLELLETQRNKLGPNLLILPESDGQTNDLFLLIKYQLDWFKKMQNTDGSVHFIVSSEDGTERYQQVSDISSGAACILAGIFAKAYPLFNTIDAAYAADLLSRAQLSWTWLTSHTSTYNPKGKNGKTWSYGISSDGPFRNFAAVELYIATGTSAYRTYYENTSFSSSDTALQGISARAAGNLDYVKTTRTVNTTKKNAIISSFTSVANTLVTNSGYSPYRTPMRVSNELYWGSSGMMACNAYISLKVFEWTGNTQYRDAALNALEWIGGRNPVSRVFITGCGDYLHGTDYNSFYYFDHLNPVPGYLSGNINCLGYGSNWLDAYIQYPWKYYMSIQNASLLEPCLPWQAELCYLLGWFATDLKIPGDVNFSGTVSTPDLILFAKAWLSSTGDANWNPYCDISVPADGIINYLDFAVFANHWLAFD